MSLKAELEAIVYAAETPITLEQIVPLVKATVVAAGAADDAEVRSRVRSALEELIAEYGNPDHGIEIRQVAGGYRMSTKPEQHEVVRSFAKSLKPPVRLSLPALETLAVIAYKQPVTVPEIAEIRGVDSGGVISTLLDRKLITTAGRKQVIGRPILYKTTKEFLMRFGLKDISELPSMEEFEKLVAASFQSELVPAEVEATAPAAETGPLENESEDTPVEDASEESAQASSTNVEHRVDAESEDEIKKSAAPVEN
jgi:segregation and condensation protein B